MHASRPGAKVLLLVTASHAVAFAQTCSTLIEEISGSSLSRGMGRRVWPFDLAHGAKTNCR